MSPLDWIRSAALVAVVGAVASSVMLDGVKLPVNGSRRRWAITRTLLMGWIGIALLAGTVAGVVIAIDSVVPHDPKPSTPMQAQDKRCADSYENDQSPTSCDGFQACTLDQAVGASQDCDDWKNWPADPRRSHILFKHQQADRAQNPDAYRGDGDDDDPGFDPDDLPDSNNCYIGDC